MTRELKEQNWGKYFTWNTHIGMYNYKIKIIIQNDPTLSTLCYRFELIIVEMLCEQLF